MVAAAPVSGPEGALEAVPAPGPEGAMEAVPVRPAESPMGVVAVAAVAASAEGVAPLLVIWGGCDGRQI